MAVTIAPPDQFQRVLLRRGVGALAASREECIDCGRTPLTGERVHLYEGRRGGLVCELCRTLRREPPAASELVRHCEHGHGVRLTVRVTRPDERSAAARERHDALDELSDALGAQHTRPGRL